MEGQIPKDTKMESEMEPEKRKAKAHNRDMLNEMDLFARENKSAAKNLAKQAGNVVSAILHGLAKIPVQISKYGGYVVDMILAVLDVLAFVLQSIWGFLCRPMLALAQVAPAAPTFLKVTPQAALGGPPVYEVSPAAIRAALRSPPTTEDRLNAFERRCKGFAGSLGKQRSWVSEFLVTPFLASWCAFFETLSSTPGFKFEREKVMHGKAESWFGSLVVNCWKISATFLKVLYVTAKCVFAGLLKYLPPDVFLATLLVLVLVYCLARFYFHMLAPPLLDGIPS